MRGSVASARAPEPRREGQAPDVPTGLPEWVERHAAELRRHLTRMLTSEADADDVLQEVWITALRRPPDDGPGSNVRAWLYRVSTNAALDRLARDRRRRDALCGRAHELAPDPREADERLAGLDERGRQRVRSGIARLPRKQRDAVWLRWVEGLDYETIARRIDSTAESARANVYVGLKKLRAELFDLWQGEMAG